MGTIQLPADIGDATPGAPFVLVLRDAATGRVIIALDDTAADGLDRLLDTVDLHDMAQNPGYHGLDADDAAAITTVGGAIRSQLGKHLRGF